MRVVPIRPLFQLIQLNQVLENSKPDLIIFQATTGGRLMFSRDFDETIRLSEHNGLKNAQNMKPRTKEKLNV